MLLSRARRRIPLSLPRNALPQPRIATRRYASKDTQLPSLPKGAAPGPYLNDSFATHTMFTVDFFRRFLKFTAIGFVLLGATGLTAFEAAHLYVEHSGLSPETDEEVKKWEWDLEADRWTGSPNGGSDPALGFYGRHAIRSAWMVLNWGTGSNTDVVASKAFTGREGQGATLAPIQASLEYGQEFLRVAIESAEKAQKDGKIHPGTLTALLARRADVVERMGTRNSLDEARSEYERIWSQLAAKGPQAAHIALKLGDLNRRLGDTEDALAWWTRSIQLAQGGENTETPTNPPSVPESVPSSPLAQRTLVSALVSLSAFYATTGQLKQAQACEDASLKLLRSLPAPRAFDAATPPQALHLLYILHRSSILSIHHAEVLYALRKGSATSIDWLSQAAHSSERVALSLSGLPPVHPDAPGSKIPHPPSSETPLAAEYTNSKSMHGPAKALLRDARRTAAEAWNLIGVLSEGSGSPDANAKALECYERALGWAGVGRDKAGGIGQPGEGTLDTEYETFWANYVRTRDAVRSQEKR
ncbi:hypothetical protein BD310DRAFT_30441 [Dichomitus squalens]|uniref:TPR-like protein n=1 Tax=Dichomitus squalens TaxID=114155 RepID=A0A4Q9QDK9_9APHY|nr:hypothetical protein BD310DRAFT_30441 [Dichomitus squalens]